MEQKNLPEAGFGMLYFIYSTLLSEKEMILMSLLTVFGKGTYFFI